MKNLNPTPSPAQSGSLLRVPSLEAKSRPDASTHQVSQRTEATVVSVFDARFTPGDIHRAAPGSFGVATGAEMGQKLWSTHSIANYTAQGLSALVRAAINNKLGDTAEDRAMLGAYLRVMLRAGDNLTNERLGKRVGESAEVNYIDFLAKPATGASPSMSREKKLSDGTVQPAMPTDGMKTVRDKIQAIQKALVRELPKLTAEQSGLRGQWTALEQDTQLAMQAVARFSTGWRPLEVPLAAVMAGVTNPCRSYAELSKLDADRPPLPSTWRSTIASEAVKRLKSYGALKRDWDRDAAELRAKEPKYGEMPQLLAQLQFPERRADFSKLTEWCKAHGAAALRAFDVSAQLQLEIAKETKRPFDYLMAANPELKGVFERMVAYRDLTSRIPTYTEIDPVKHPIYFVLSAPQSGGLYQDLQFDRTTCRGAVTILALDHQDGLVFEERLRLPLRVDARFRRVLPAGDAAPQAKPEGSSTKIKRRAGDPRIRGRYFDTSQHAVRDDFVVKGARLVPTISDPKTPVNNRYHLSFVTEYSVPNAPKNLSAIRQSGGSVLTVCYGFTAGVWRDGVVLAELAEGEVTCGRSLSVEPVARVNARHLGGDVKAGESVKRHDTLVAGLLETRRAIAEARSATGRLARGESPNKALESHLDDGMTQYRQELAHRIVGEALTLGAKFILVPYFKGVRPDRSNSPELNALISMKGRAEFEKILEQTAKRASIAIVRGSPFGLSSVCSACGELGIVVPPAAEVSTDTRQNELDSKKSEPAVHQFACSCCDCVLPVEENGARNLARQIPLLADGLGFGDELRQAVAPKLWAFHQQFQTREARSAVWQQIRDKTRARLRAMNRPN